MWDLGRCSLNPSCLLVIPIALTKASGLPGDVDGSTSWHIRAFRGQEPALAMVQNCLSCAPWVSRSYCPCVWKALQVQPTTISYFTTCVSLLPSPGYKLLPQAQFQFALSEAAILYWGPERWLRSDSDMSKFRFYMANVLLRWPDIL